MPMMDGLKHDTSLDELYSLHQLDSRNIPVHIAMIMDGNGRWATSRKLPRTSGHQEGAEALKRALELCSDFGIKYLSVYTFSTENWTRPRTEVIFLMRLLKSLLRKEKKMMIRNGIRFRRCGFRDNVPADLLQVMDEVEEETANNSTMQLNLLFNYGARQELLNAVEILRRDDISDSNINQDRLNSLLFTHDSPDPDILIRTGGDYRLSNFMLWQASYTELFFLDTLWPDFGETQFVDVIKEFQSRHRRYGGL